MSKLVIFGAGAIGCFVGGHWALAGCDVTLIGRHGTFAGFCDSALRLTGGRGMRVPATRLKLANDAAAMSSADVILLAMKSTALGDACSALMMHARQDATIITLLNGVAPAGRVRDALPGREVLRGMVPFNVVWRSPGHLHRSSAGKLCLEQHSVSATLAAAVSQSGVPVRLYDDLRPIQYGKLLLNLINPINALSGLSLHAMLSQSGYRTVYAAVLDEAVRVYDAAGVTWTAVGPIVPAFATRMLRWPDWLFNATLLRVQGIDRTSQTSMTSDLAAGRPTEIDDLNGEIVRLAQTSGVKSPLNATLVELIREGAGPLSAHHMARHLGL